MFLGNGRIKYEAQSGLTAEINVHTECMCLVGHQLWLREDLTLMSLHIFILDS